MALRLVAGVVVLALAGAAAAQEERVELPLRAGAAVVEIAVPERVPLAGYGGRGPGNHNEGRLAPVDARALVVAGRGGRPCVGLVTLDILIVTPTLRQAIRERAAALELDGLIIAATHTHSGPGGYYDLSFAEVGVMGWYDPAALRALTDAAASALTYAKRALAPAALGVAVATSATLAFNRRHPGGSIDPSIPVLRVDGASGETIATLFSLAAHASVLRQDNLHLSPDYPGAARDFVEARRGGIALFVAGPLGDQNPLVSTPGAPPGDAAAQRRGARELGDRLGELVAEAAELASPADDAPVAFVEIPFEPPAIDVRGACAGWIFAPVFNLVARLTFPSVSVLAAVRLAGLRLLASPYELGVDVAARIRSRVGGPLMLVAHANETLGYLLEPDDFPTGGYETCLAFHGNDAAPPFAEAAVRLLNELESAAARPAINAPR